MSKKTLAARIEDSLRSRGAAKYATTPTSCTCLGFRYRGTCKHVVELTTGQRAVEDVTGLSEEDARCIRDMENLF